MSYVKSIILICIGIFLITFGIQNSGPVQLGYYLKAFDIELLLYALSFICLLIGVAAGMLIDIRQRLIHRRRVKNLEKDNKALNDQLLLCEEKLKRMSNSSQTADKPEGNISSKTDKEEAETTKEIHGS